MLVAISWLKIRISINITVEFEDVNVSNSETEFYMAVFAQIEIFEKFASQHEIMCWLVNDFDKIDIPLMANENLLKEFRSLAGPPLDVLLDTADGGSSFYYGLKIGVA